MKLSKRMEHVKASEIREILKLTQQPSMISFAGGLPAPELFPIDAIREANDMVLKKNGMEALQYTTTEGYLPLREWIASRLNTRLQTKYDADAILITHGSQQALDLAGKVFLDEGDIVLCESPTYLAAISAFKMFGASFVAVDCDRDGMMIEALEKAIQNNKNCKLIYVISDFQNPSGRSYSLERRQQLAATANRYDIPLLEDNPYGELRFNGEQLAAISSFDTKDNCMITGTFSKIFCPGYRIGWIAGDPALIRKFVLVKQGTDLQCNTMAQMAIYEYLKVNDIDQHISKIKAIYKHRLEIIVDAMKKHFPKEVTWNTPDGGLFLWVVLPTWMNAKALLIKSVERQVAFVPGGPFFPNGGNENTLRLNFSNMQEERIVQGIEVLGQLLKEEIHYDRSLNESSR